MRFFVLVVLLLAACSSPPQTHAPTVAQIESVARIDIPAAAADVQGFLETGGMDDFAAVRFALPASAFDGFLKRAGYSEPLKPVTPLILEQFNDPELANRIPGWPTPEQWDALAAIGYLVGVSESEPGFNRSIIVDRSDPNRYIIYLIHFEL